MPTLSSPQPAPLQPTGAVLTPSICTPNPDVVFTRQIGATKSNAEAQAHVMRLLESWVCHEALLVELSALALQSLIAATHRWCRGGAWP